MTSSTQDLLPQLDIGNTFGALFIGVNLAAILFGITNVQAFVYFQTHRGTGMTFYKWAVILLWILDALHLALITHCVYYYLVINYANISYLTEIVWSFKLQIIIDVLIVYGVRVLYVYRIWIVNRGRSKVLPVIVAIIVILGSGVCISLVWAVYDCHVFTDLVKIEWATLMALGTIAFVDFVVAASLSYLLATSRTGFSSTDSFLMKLMAYTIHTGFLTSVTSMAAIITCAVMPRNFIFLGIVFFIAKLYVNSYLALLNARYYLEPSAGTSKSSGYQIHRGDYHPELHTNVSQDENSRTSMSKHLDEEALSPTRPVQAVMPQRPIALMDMGSYSKM